MKRDKRRKGKKSNYKNRLSLFQRPDMFNRSCPLSVKDAPSIDYKDIKKEKEKNLIIKTG